MQSEAGLVSITGTPDDAVQGRHLGRGHFRGHVRLLRILAALLRRERTGEGATLDVSLFDSLAEWMGFPAYYTGYGGAPPPRSGARNAVIAPYGPYAAGDGKVVYLGLQNEREWSRFCARRARASRPGRRSSASTRTRSGWRRATRWMRRSRPRSRRSTAAEVDRPARVGGDREREDEHRSGVPGASTTRGARPLASVDSPVGPLRAVVPPFNIDGVEIPMGPIPAVGEHTDAILGEFGFSAGTVDEWRRAGIV